MKTGTSLERLIEASGGGPIRAVGGKGYATAAVASTGRCAAANRGEEVWVRGGSGAADTKYVCMKKSDDTYAWVGVTPFASVLTGTLNINTGALVHGAAVSQTATVTGAAVGDVCLCSANSTASNEWNISCHVSASNTARVTIENVTGGNSSLSASNSRCYVFKRP